MHAYSARNRSFLASDRAIAVSCLWPVWASSCLEIPLWLVAVPALARGPGRLDQKGAAILHVDEVGLVFSQRVGRVLGRADELPALIGAVLDVLLHRQHVARTDGQGIVSLAKVFGAGEITGGLASVSDRISSESRL